jgi:hypothetical protein
VQSTIEMVQDHPSFHNETCEQVRANAEMIVESIQTHLGERNQTIRGIRLDEFTRMVRLTLENNFILPDDGVPPNVNDNASRADSVSETAPTLQAQSNSEENSSNEPKRKGPQKCMYCGELRKGHVCSAIRSFDAWTWTETKENSHIPAEIQEGAPIGEQDREVEVSREEWTQCVPNHDLTSDLEHQEEREVAPSAKSQRRTAKIRLKKKRKTDDCSPPSEGRPREEQVNTIMFLLLIVVAYETPTTWHVTQTKMILFFIAGKTRSRRGAAPKRYGGLRRRRHDGRCEQCRYNCRNGSFQSITRNWRI